MSAHSDPRGEAPAGSARVAVSRSGLRFVALVVVAAVIVVVGSPIFGWFPVVRVSAVVWAILLAAAAVARPWRWTVEQWTTAAAWTPQMRHVSIGTAVLAVVLFWLVYSRFQAGGIDAVDFTVYFDRPLYQTSIGRIYNVESSDDPRFAQLTHLAVHGYWILLPLAGLYWVHASPLWLLALSVIAVAAGARHVFRIVKYSGGSGVVATAAALAFALTDNTARALNYGFHAEILYAWFVPWALDAGMRRARVPFLAAVGGSLLVKEDAIFVLVAVAAALALNVGRSMSRAERLTFLVLPPALAFVNLTVFYLWIVPRLAPEGQVMYSYFWASSGATPWQAISGLISQPSRLVHCAVTSGFFSLVLSRHLYLPLLGWRWILGLVPAVLVYGASDSPQIRGFGIYYAVPFVPFLAIATAQGARLLMRSLLRQPVAEVVSAGLVLASALALGLGYSLRPWKPELRNVREAVVRLESHSEVLVQGGLYVHAGYDSRVQLLTPHGVRAVEDKSAVMLLARRVSYYPLRRQQWRCLISLPRVAPMPPGLVAVAADAAARDCIRPTRTGAH